MSYQIQSRTVEAARFMGENQAEIEALAGEGVIEWDPDTEGRFAVVTPAGRVGAGVGDFVVKIDDARCYPMNPKVFAALQS